MIALDIDDGNIDDFDNCNPLEINTFERTKFS